jgi:hypothetical protein
MLISGRSKISDISQLFKFITDLCHQGDLIDFTLPQIHLYTWVMAIIIFSD